MQKKLPLKDVLAAIDLNAKNVWDELSDEERKQVSEKWFQIDDENTIAINSLADVEESLVNNLEKSLEDFLENAFEACPYENDGNNI